MSDAARKRLIVTFTVDAERDPSLNAWYNLEHIAPRRGMSEGHGFRTCDRFFVSNGAARYLNVYDLDDDALDSAEYADIREAEASMKDVEYHTGHFKTAHAPQFRRLVVERTEQLAGTTGEHGSADATMLDIVRGRRYDDLPVWTRTTLRAMLETNELVTSSAVWNIDGDDGFVLMTDVDLSGVFDWNRVYGGALGWLPKHTTEGIEDEVIVGHSIARFVRTPSAV
jgi:hypothetical protein